MNVYDLVEGGPSTIEARINLLLDQGILVKVLPELVRLIPNRNVRGHKNNFAHTIQVIKQTHDLSNGNADLKVAALMHDLGKAETARFVENKGWTFHGHEDASLRIIDTVFDRQGLSRDKRDYVKTIVEFAGKTKEISKEFTTDNAIRRFASLLNNDVSVISDVITFASADITTKYDDKRLRFRLAHQALYDRVISIIKSDEESKWRMCVDANDIMAVTGLVPGRLLGTVKKELEDMVKSGNLNDNPDDVLEKAREILSGLKCKNLPKLDS